MKNNFRNIDTKALVDKLRPKLKNQRTAKAILGLNFIAAKSAVDIKRIYYGIKNNTFYYLEKTQEASVYNYRGLADQSKINEGAAFYRWLDVSQEEIDASYDYHSAYVAWEGAPHGTYVKENGLLKMLEFAETEEQIQFIFNASARYSYAERMACKKMATYCPAEIVVS